MDKLENNKDLSQWFSTYGLITAERILGRFNVHLTSNELLVALKSPVSFYHRLLQVPLKNVLNGIVLQQANDYHVYAQKLFIDYLLSGESGKDPASQGAYTRESLEDERKDLVTLGDEYNHTKLEHDTLIAESQQVLIKLTKQWNAAQESAMKLIGSALKLAGIESKKSTIRQAINHTMIHCDLSNQANAQNKQVIVAKFNEVLKETLTDSLTDKIHAHLQELLTISVEFDDNISVFEGKSKEMSVLVQTYRTRFYETILRVTTLINLLPEYKIDQEKDTVNREMLHFDNSIGA